MPALPDALFREAFEASPNGIVLVDDGGRIVVANRRFGELFGYDPDALAGVSVDRLVPDTSRQRHAARRRDYASGDAEPVKRRR